MRYRAYIPIWAVCVYKHLVIPIVIVELHRYALSYIILYYIHDMCIYDDESMHRESRLVGGSGGDAGAGEPKKKPVSSIASRTHITSYSGAVVKKHRSVECWAGGYTDSHHVRRVGSRTLITGHRLIAPHLDPRTRS